MYIFLKKVFASPQRLSTFCPVVQLKSSHDFSAEANTALPETALSVLAGVWLGMWGGDRIGRKEGILGTSSSSPELRAVLLVKPFRFCWGQAHLLDPHQASRLRNSGQKWSHAERKQSR